MANTRKSKPERVTRKNVDFYDAELQMAEELMRHRNRGNNFSRLVRDLVHEEHERIAKKINPGRDAQS